MKTINEVELETGISAYTIRYYDKCGFFRNLARTSQGRRRFSETDVQRLLLIDALRKSGLSIDGLKNIAPKLDDESYREEIIALCNQRMTAMMIQMEDLQDCMNRLKHFIDSKV